MLTNIIRLLKRVSLIILFSIGIFSSTIYSQDEFICGTSTASSQSSQTGGLYITSQGTLKILVVFARFKDDTDTHGFWPVGGNPIGWDTYIDPTTQTGSTNFLHLTNYYNTMTFGSLHVIGQAVSVETPQNKSSYSNRF